MITDVPPCLVLCGPGTNGFVSRRQVLYQLEYTLAQIWYFVLFLNGLVKPGLVTQAYNLST